MMKISLKSYGTFILLGVIANIIIFYFFSKQLEEYVYYKTVDKYNAVKVEKAPTNGQGQPQAHF